jgi:hypothetical protein
VWERNKKERGTYLRALSCEHPPGIRFRVNGYAIPEWVNNPPARYSFIAAVVRPDGIMAECNPTLFLAITTDRK